MGKPNDGYYTIVYAGGAYRTMRVKTASKGGLRGKTILSFKEMGEYVGCGFIQPDGSIYFWKNFKSNNTIQRLGLIRAAFRKIVETPQEYQLAYAMKENCCARCGRKLSVPASLHAGFGPECAGRTKGWRKADHQAAFAGMRGKAAQAATPKVIDELDKHLDETGEGPRESGLSWSHMQPGSN